MRILHTADWHLGRVFHRVNLIDDQRYVLDQLVEHVRAHHVDVVLIAGDVYDRSLPPAEAVQMLDEVLAELVLGCDVHVLLVAGNHDSMTRLGFGSRLLRGQRLHIFGRPQAEPEPVLLADEHGEVAFFGVPYPEPSIVRELLDDDEVRDHHAAMLALAQAARRRCPARTRSVLVTHADVQGATASESERALSINRPQAVGHGAFEGFDYVALGHLHRPQASGPAIHFSGSILPYSFSEAADDKSVKLVELGAAGAPVKVRSLPLAPRHRVRSIEGRFAEILAAAEHDGGREDYLRIRLLDEGPLFETVTRLRQAYPNVLEIERAALAAASTTSSAPPARRGDDELAQFSAFFEHATGDTLDDELRAELMEVISELRGRQP